LESDVVYLFIYLFVYLFVCLFIYLFVYLFIYLFVYLFIYLFVYLFIHLFIRLFIYSFIYSFIYLFIYLFIRLFIRLFICLFICLLQNGWNMTHIGPTPQELHFNNSTLLPSSNVEFRSCISKSVEQQHNNMLKHRKSNRNGGFGNGASRARKIQISCSPV
jgi:hypothetical protein